MPVSTALLNGICPYFTMFPLEFPQELLKRAKVGDVVLDPFCGRGTTNFAARQAGLESVGVDSSPVAAAITASKLVYAKAEDIVKEAYRILEEEIAADIPEGDFWEWAYHPEVLVSICKLRKSLMTECSTPTRIALRGIILGALHGPIQKTVHSYFSNQCPRTYAPKPRYATNFWSSRDLYPPKVDVLGIIKRKAERYYGIECSAFGEARLGDSRLPGVLSPFKENELYSWVITSPPYYGMKTYIPDQWLRNWFVGGPSIVQYENKDQLAHSSPEIFADELRKVWLNAFSVSKEESNLIIRFGGISDRKVNPLDVIRNSLENTGWIIKTINEAGLASEGKRQADYFLRVKSKPLVELDVWAVKA